MPEISHARRILGDGPGRSDGAQLWRKGFGRDNAQGSFCLSLRTKDGRNISGPSMSLFTWHDWIDDGGQVERLILFFSVGAVYVEGLHMKSQVESALEEGKLKWIQEHDAAEIEAIRQHNRDKCRAEDKEPIVLRLLVAPDLQARLKASKHGAVIAAAMKGERGETRNAANPE
jgi:hypothetical protein